MPLPLTNPATSTLPPSSRRGSLVWWEKTLIAGFFVLLVAFGAVVLKRAAFSSARKTDAQVFFRAGWAVRADKDIYAVTARGWHYIYPPLFAITMAPLSDPPPGEPRPWTLPYPVSIGIWYAISVASGLLAIHWLAKSCEEAEPPGPEPTSHDWCRHRFVPFLMCAPCFGNTLTRGQTNLLLLLLIAGAIRAFSRRKDFAAGMWLGWAICLKVMPAFLLLMPLWHRSKRWLLGTAAALLLGLVVIPILALGPQRTWQYAQHWTNKMFVPVLSATPNPTLESELLSLGNTDNNSIQGIVHVWTHFGTPRNELPPYPSKLTRAIHWTLGGALTLATLFAAGPPRRHTPMIRIMTLGMLTSVMILVSPICHPHYLVFALPLVVPLVFLGSKWTGPRAYLWQWVLATLYCTLYTLGLLPGLKFFEQYRLNGLVGIALWTYGWWTLRSLSAQARQAAGSSPIAAHA